MRCEAWGRPWTLIWYLSIGIHVICASDKEMIDEGWLVPKNCGQQIVLADVLRHKVILTSHSQDQPE